MATEPMVPLVTSARFHDSDDVEPAVRALLNASVPRKRFAVLRQHGKTLSPQRIERVTAALPGMVVGSVAGVAASALMLGGVVGPLESLTVGIFAGAVGGFVTGAGQWRFRLSTGETNDERGHWWLVVEGRPWARRACQVFDELAPDGVWAGQRPRQIVSHAPRWSAQLR